MSKRITLSIAALCLILHGCGTTDSPRKRAVEVVLDISASVSSGSRSAAVDASEALVLKLERGDHMSVVPIVGDADQVQGQIIRVVLPDDSKRQAYDHDLRDIQRLVHESLCHLKTRTLANPGQRTDLLGAVRVASQEFGPESDGSQRFLLVLSDLLQDDGTMNFATLAELRTEARSRALAQRLASLGHPDLRGVRAYLGMLESTCFARLSPERRRAVQTFWKAYLEICGATTTVATDGPGLLPMFVSEVSNPKLTWFGTIGSVVRQREMERRPLAER